MAMPPGLIYCRAAVIICCSASVPPVGDEVIESSGCGNNAAPSVWSGDAGVAACHGEAEMSVYSRSCKMSTGETSSCSTIECSRSLLVCSRRMVGGVVGMIAVVDVVGCTEAGSAADWAAGEVGGSKVVAMSGWAAIPVGRTEAGTTAGWAASKVGSSKAVATSGWTAGPVGRTKAGTTAGWAASEVGSSKAGSTSGWAAGPVGRAEAGTTAGWAVGEVGGSEAGTTSGW